MALKGIKNYGFGLFDTTDTPIMQAVGLFPLLSSFKIMVEAETVEAQGYGDDGLLQVVDTFNSTEKVSVECGFQSVDWLTMQFFLGEFAQETASLSVPLIKTAIIPSGDYTITDSDLTGLTVDDVQVTFIDSNQELVEPLEVITGTPAAANEIKLDAGTLVAHSTAAGRAVKYMARKTYTNAPTIGWESAADLVDKMEFNGVMVGHRFGDVLVNIPLLTRKGGFELTLPSDSQTITFTASVKAGNRKAIRFAKPATL